MEEELNSVYEEVAPQNSESNSIETEETKVENLDVNKSHDLEDKQEKNWRELRRKQREAEIREKAKDELIERLLKERNQVVPEKKQEQDEFSTIDPEDFLTMRQTDNRIQRRAEEIAEKKYREFRQKEEQEKFLERLQKKYSDFSDIVNPDSIEILEKNEPELASTIAELKDPYKIGLQTYHYLKRMNLSEQISKNKHAREVEKKLEKNEKTVSSPQAYNKRPMAQAFELTQAQKSSLYKEMIGFASQGGFSY